MAGRAIGAGLEMDVTALKLMAAGLMSWINIQADLPVPADPPDVQFLAHTELEQDVCHQECSLLGFSPHDGGPVVYLDSTLDVENNVCHRGILLHELVHYMQRTSGRFADEPPAVQTHLREMEALRIQNAYLSQYGRRIYIGTGFAATGLGYPNC